jgi:hypothetical protein
MPNRSTRSSHDMPPIRDRVPFKIRAGSFVVDLGLYLFIAIPAIDSVIARLGLGQPDDWGRFVIVPLLYWVGFVAIGVTPASWLFDIRIVNQHGRMPGPWRAVRRSLVPGTVWLWAASDAYLFHPWIDATYEAHPFIDDVLFWVGYVGLLFWLVVYLTEGGRGDCATHLHDAIAGTRVVSHRSERKAALIRGCGNLEVFLCRRSGLNLAEWMSCHVQALSAWRKRNGCRES